MAAHIRCQRSVSAASKCSCAWPVQYYYKKNLSFLKHMTPEFSPFLFTLNKIPTIQLKVQYQMVPEISALADIVSRRNVHTRIVPANRVQLTHPKRTGTELSTVFTGYLVEMRFEHITPHAVWIYPYVSQHNATSTIVTDEMRHINGYCQERILSEAVVLQIIVETLLNELPVKRIVNHMCILSSYHAH